MTPADRTLWDTYIRTRSDADRNALVMRYYKVAEGVVTKVMKKAPPHVDPDDVLQAGMLGMMDAIQRFDPARGIEPGTFLGRRVHGAILDWQRDVDFVPRLVRARSTTYARAVKELERKLNRLPEDDEIREHLKLSEWKYAKVKRDSQAIGTLSINVLQANKNPHTRDFTIADKLVDPKAEDPYTTAERADMIQWLLSRIQPRFSFFLIHYFLTQKTMEQIGRENGTSESRVSQLVNQAIRLARAAA